VKQHRSVVSLSDQFRALVSSAVWNASAAALVIAASGACGSAAGADEGMWLLNQAPAAALTQRHAFEPSPEWLTHVQRSAVRYGGGGSASLVSADGLVLTNHHVALDGIEKLSTGERNLVRDGFVAKTREEELAIPGAECSILWQIEDVTDRVRGAAKSGLDPAAAEAARRAEISAIEAEARERLGLARCEVVTLYGGARFHLYASKRFTDVRLVWAPEDQIGSFGGDHDNFEYPRFAIDASLVRLYENGQPYKPEHFLKWNTQGSKEGDLVFVVGHPGRTSRLFTPSHVAFLRDVELPGRLAGTYRSEVRDLIFAGRSEENERLIQGELSGVQNGRKFMMHLLGNLQDPVLMERKRADAASLEAGASEATRAALHAANAQVDASLKEFREIYPAWSAMNPRSDLFAIALGIDRMTIELAKPSGERLREYRDAVLPSARLRLLSPAPLDAGVESHLIELQLSLLAERLGGDDPTVRRMLAGKPPRDRAREVVAGTRLMTVAAREALLEGGPAAVAASDDPAIVLARHLNAAWRPLRDRFDARVEAPQRAAYAAIADARFDVLGEWVYPDATGTLRLSFGTIRGYQNPGEPAAPAFTTLGGLFARSEEKGARPPFDLPPRWLERRDKIDPTTPLNLVCDADIIGGNSGSPLVDREGRLVGLIFDGNLEFMATDVVYPGGNGRALAVDSRAITHVLRTIYDAPHLADELEAGGK